MSNYSIFEQNMLLSLEHEDSQALYLRAKHKDEPRAYAMAMTWDRYLGHGRGQDGGFPGIYWLVNKHHELFHGADVGDEVIQFFRERYFYMEFPKNSNAKTPAGTSSTDHNNERE